MLNWWNNRRTSLEERRLMELNLRLRQEILNLRRRLHQQRVGYEDRLAELEHKLADLRDRELLSLQRQLEAEKDYSHTLEQVQARDRKRIQSETAAYAKLIAEADG